MNLDNEKLEIFNKAVLSSGSHSDFEAGVCAMELVSYVAGEKFSDRPQCVCPALTSYVMILNDFFKDEERQLLKPYLLKLLGTRDGNTLERARILAHASITVFAPFALDNAGLSKEAEELRKIKFGDWSVAQSVAQSAAESATRSAQSATRSAAESAAWSARSAAWSVKSAESAAWSAIWSAGRAALSAESAALSARSAALSVSSAAESANKRQPILQEALKSLKEAIDVK